MRHGEAAHTGLVLQRARYTRVRLQPPGLALRLTAMGVYRAKVAIDPSTLAEFRADLRRRYSDEQILAELRGCAERLGRSPTMREFAADELTTAHPQTVVEHFGTWNDAKRAAGLVPRRHASRDELLEQLRSLGRELGRIPTSRDLDEHRGRVPSTSLVWKTFGSLAAALHEAGFDVPLGEERLERALNEGSALALVLGRLPRFTDWRDARAAGATLTLTEWQVYRMFEPRRGAWSAFQYRVRERLLERGARVERDGSVAPGAVEP